jgi:adenylosuccinate lyase
LITRYAHPEMSAVWSAASRFDKWLRIELLTCEGWGRLGRIPKASLIRLRRAHYDARRIEALEETVGHDVIAFVSAVAETVGAEGRFLHLGLTSSDVVDTAFALQLCEAADLLHREVHALGVELRRQARRHRTTLMVGRTHGMHAEPTSWGLVLLGWADDLRRGEERLLRARAEVAVGKLAGAVGTHATVDPQVEEYVLGKLGLAVAPVTTQVIARDRHAAFLTTLAILGGTLEKIATDLRLLQRTEVGEVQEPFGEGQKGSSAMPHKRNPILSERVCGLARTLRGYALTALENVALWHERDISHSSAERVIFPDACGYLYYMVRLMRRILAGLQVFPERMQQNLWQSGGIVFSQRILLALVEKGMAREAAYRVVQRAAERALSNGRDFRTILERDPQVRRVLTPRELKALFDPGFYLRFVPVSFARAGAK